MATLERVDPQHSTRQVTSEIFDRQPPCNLEAERAVLGSLLIKPDACDDVVLIVRPHDFYDEGHQKIFTQLVAIHETGQRIDVTLLVERLKTAGEFD